MRHQRVGDVMTRDVVTVTEQTPFQEIARVLAAHRVDGVPVLGPDGRLIGVVTEADLLARQARAGGASSGPLQRLLRRKSFAPNGSAHTAADLATTPAVTVGSADRLTTAAATLARHGIKRLPVVDADGKLVGIVSRKDVLSVYLRDDTDLATEIRTTVLTEAMCVPRSDVTVEVSEGVVSLRGKVERRSMIEIISALVAAVDGVVAVHNEITSDFDDLRLPRPEPENVGVLHRFIAH